MERGDTEYETSRMERTLLEMQQNASIQFEKISNLQQSVQKLRAKKHYPGVGVSIRDRRIPDSAMTASSCWDGLNAYKGRLDNNDGFWHPAANQNDSSWIQVDLGRPTRLVGIITQGRPDNYPDWVITYKIFYGNSPSNLISFQSEQLGGDMVFQGNRDRTTKVTNMFPHEIVTRYVRLQVLTYSRMPVVRLEYLTC